MKDKIKFKVETNYSAGGLIKQTIKEGEPSLRQIIQEKIINTQEEGIRKALIGLGWTPPKIKFEEELCLKLGKKVKIKAKKGVIIIERIK